MHKFSVKKPLTIFVIMIAILALGVVAYMKMTPDLLPNMDFPYVIVVTTYPGATPEKVEEEVSKPLEQSMATLEHIKQISSTSAENYSTVILEFEEDVNMDTIGVDIQQQILSLSGTWDEMVGTPYVLKINPSMLPVQVAGVSMEGKDTIELTNFLNETLMTKLEGIPGVARISATGMVQQELHVILDQDLIDAANRKVIDAINAEVDKAADELEDQKAELEDTKEEMEGASGQMEAGVNQMINGEQQLNAEKSKLLKAQKELEEGMRTLKSTYEVLKLLNDRVEKVVATQTSTQQHLNDLTSLQSQRLQLAELHLQIQALKAEIAILEGVEEILPTEPTTPPTQATEPTEPNTEATEPTEPNTEATEPTVPATAALEPVDPAALDETSAEELTQTIDVSTEDIMPLDLDDVELANLKLQLVQLEADLATKEAAYNAAMLAAGVTSDTLDKETLTAAAEAELAKAAVLAIDELLKTEGMDRQKLRDTLTELENQIQQLEETAKQLESGLLTIEEAEELLQAQKLKGLLQMSTAAGQMAAGAGTIDMALTQIETGLETIEDAREDSLRQADLNNIITMDMVSQILTAQNFAMPAGYVEEDGINYMVSVGEEITELSVLEDLLLFDMGMEGVDPIYLSDVAVVVMTDNSDETYAKLGTQDGVVLTFEKQSTYATAKTTENIAQRFEELEAEYPGLKFDSLMNQGDYIFMVVESILSNLLLGALFSVLILFIFLRDIRPTLITLCSIPISVIFAVVLMYFSGVTLNMISLSGLAISVGMLVDNSIVVIENIYRLRAKGANIIQAAVSGAGQVFGAITASTLTTVCVFFPIVFVEGITKQLFADLALTVTYALMASLIIAITLVPAMSIKMLKKQKVSKEGRLGGALMGFYRKTVELALKGKIVVLILAGVLLLGSVGMGLSKGFIFFPDMDSPMITVSVDMPDGTTREEAIEIADEMLARIAKIENIDAVGATMEISSGMDTGISLTSGALSAYITLESDKMSGAEVAKRIEESCADLPCTISASSAIIDMSMLTGSGISVQIFADDMDKLQNAAKDVAGLLERMEGVAEVSDGMEDAAPAYHVDIDRNEAMKNGLTVAQIYMELAAGLTKDGTVASLELDDVSTDVVIEKPEGAVLDVQELRDYVFEVTDREGNIKEVPLSDFATIEETTSLTSINRIDQRRYMTVTATLEEGYNVTLLTQEAEQIVGKADLGKGVSYTFAGENQMIMEAVEQMVLMLALGMLLVYLIMAAQFQSLKSPFVVMFTIPLAFTGGFMALMICGMEVSILSLVGFALLMGVIVNNGIVLVDCINQLRLEGKERREAIIEAGATRIRPILMTTLTTILGQLVMAISQDFGSRLMRPIAVVSIGGLLYATLMTLYVIPCIYDMVNKKELHKVDDKDLEILDL